MRNVLIITQSFPPVTNIAARRYGYMAEYFEEFGWKPWILTTRSEGELPVNIKEEQIIRIGRHSQRSRDIECRPGALKDPVLWKRYCRAILQVLQIRLRSIDHTRFTWYREIQRRLPEIRTQLPNIDVVIGSFGPSGALYAARLLAREYGAPWVADFRDLAALNSGDRNVLSRILDLLNERMLIRSASAVTSVSPTTTSLLHKKHKLRSRTIYNGWHQHQVDSHIIGCHKVCDPFTPLTHTQGMQYLYYAGRFYSHQIMSVKFIMKALERFPDLHMVIRSLGPNHLNKEIQGLAEAYNLKHRFHLLESTAPSVVYAEAQQSFANLVVENCKVTDQAAAGTLTGKFLELLPLTPPILSVARSDSDMGEILSLTNKGYLCSSIEEVVTAIRKMEAYPDTFSGNREQIVQFSKRNQAKKLCELLDQVTDQRSKNQPNLTMSSQSPRELIDTPRRKAI